MDFDKVPCDDTDSNSLSSEDEDHDEIVELSELEKFSATLKEAQRVALEVQRAKTTTRGPYTGGSRTTQYRKKKLRDKLTSNGYLGLREFMARNKPTLKKGLPIVREEEESSDSDSDGSDLEGPLSGSRASTCTLNHALREEEEESDISSHDTELTENLDGLTAISGGVRGDDNGDGNGNGDDDGNGDGTERPGGPGPARALFEELRHGLALEILDAPRTALDNALDLLCDHKMLCSASERLAAMSKDKKIEILFRARIVSMVGTLNLFLDPELDYTWRKASLVASKARGHGITHARRIREWILRFL